MDIIRIIIKSTVKTLLLFTLPSCLFLAAAPAHGEIIAGPWLQKAGPDRITVMWETDTAGESYVDYGPDDTYGLTAGSPTPVLIHEVEITGLQTDYEYHYRVRTGAATSADNVFRTAPPKGSSGFRFIAYGDSRTNEWIHTEVALAMDGISDRAFILSSGDIVPSSGSGADKFREDFFGPLAGVICETPIYVARGNHEGTNPLFVQYFAHPSAGSGSEDYFSFDYGNVHVIALDTNQAYGTGSAQRTWLESDLIASSTDPDVDWIIAVFHHPPYSTGSHGSSTSVRSALCPLFETYGVNVVFNGHDHDYERVEEQNGVVYIVTGGGGAGLRDQGTPLSWSVCFHKLHNFVTVDVTETELTIVARGVQNPGHPDGDLIDSVVITKDPVWSPTALAGPDQTADLGTVVTLDGTGSYDGEGDLFTFSWSQVGGPRTALVNSGADQPSFVPRLPGIYEFQLLCTEAGSVDSAPDRVRAGIKNPETGGDAIAKTAADTWIDSVNPDTNYGSSATLEVDASPYKLIYIRFDIPALNGALVSAKLRFYCSNSSGFGGYVRVFSDTAWNENTPTWNNPLVLDGPAVAIFDAVSFGSWAETDITAALPNFWKTPGPLSLAICPAATDGADYHSKEGANSPELVLTYSGKSFPLHPEGGPMQESKGPSEQEAPAPGNLKPPGY